MYSLKKFPQLSKFLRDYVRNSYSFLSQRNIHLDQWNIPFEFLKGMHSLIFQGIIFFECGYLVIIRCQQPLLHQFFYLATTYSTSSVCRLLTNVINLQLNYHQTISTWRLPSSYADEGAWADLYISD